MFPCFPLSHYLCFKVLIITLYTSGAVASAEFIRNPRIIVMGDCPIGHREPPGSFLSSNGPAQTFLVFQVSGHSCDELLRRV